jgi:hypothetical protein
MKWLYRIIRSNIDVVGVCHQAFTVGSRKRHSAKQNYAIYFFLEEEEKELFRLNEIDIARYQADMLHHFHFWRYRVVIQVQIHFGSILHTGARTPTSV